jgi:hypothetical protein
MALKLMSPFEGCVVEETEAETRVSAVAISARFVVHPADDGHRRVSSPRVQAGTARRGVVAPGLGEAGQPAPRQATGGWLQAVLLE